MFWRLIAFKNGYDDVLVNWTFGHDDRELIVREVYITMYDGA
jgi:hypothetical protein